MFWAIPKGKVHFHDDLANSAAGSLCLAALTAAALNFHVPEIIYGPPLGASNGLPPVIVDPVEVDKPGTRSPGATPYFGGGLGGNLSWYPGIRQQ